MSDMHDLIPGMAFLNAQIIQVAHDRGCLGDCVSEVRRKYRCAPPAGSYLFEPAHVVSMLYCLLVVPVELSLSMSGGSDPELERKNLLQYFTVDCLGRRANETETQCLLRRLRNSVAHVRYTLDANDRWCFSDLNNKGEREPGGFVVSATAKGLSGFLSAIGTYLADRCASSATS